MLVTVCGRRYPYRRVRAGGESGAARRSCRLPRRQNHPPDSGWTREPPLSRPISFKRKLGHVSQTTGHHHSVNCGMVLVDWKDLEFTF